MLEFDLLLVEGRIFMHIFYIHTCLGIEQQASLVNHPQVEHLWKRASIASGSRIIGLWVSTNLKIAIEDRPDAALHGTFYASPMARE